MKYFLTFLGILLFSLAGAQPEQNYREGYIVLLNGDTLRGQIMDRDESAFGGLIDKIRFRPDKGRKKKYKPGQIKCYARGGMLFQSLWISSETQMFRTQYFNRPGQGEEVFLKVVYRGSIELFHWEFNDDDNFTIDYFPLVRRAGSPELVRATQGILGLKRKRLSEYFADCPQLVSGLASKEISTTDQLIEAYESFCAK